MFSFTKSLAWDITIYQDKLQDEEPESPGDCEDPVHRGYDVIDPADPGRCLLLPEFIKHRGGLSTRGRWSWVPELR